MQSGWTISTACLLDERPETLPARQHFTRRDGHRRVPAEFDEAREVVRRQRFLEPDHVVVREHLRGAERPLVAVRPELLAAAGIDHQSRRPGPTVSRAVRTSSSSVFASRRPNGFQPSLIALNPRATAGFNFSRKRIDLVEEQRAVRLDPVAVDAAEQARDGLVA